MPGSNDAGRLIAGLKSSVAIPAGWDDYFEKTGPVGTCWPDLRQFPRFHLRSPAAMFLHPSLPALRRSEVPVRVYLKDISRASVAFLHGEQLFPGERLLLVMCDGMQRESTVVRCRRVQANCYEIAARFATASDSQGSS